MRPSTRAGRVQVYGIDARFFSFHGVQTAAPGPNDVLLSPDLAAELGAAAIFGDQAPTATCVSGSDNE